MRGLHSVTGFQTHVMLSSAMFSFYPYFPCWKCLYTVKPNSMACYEWRPSIRKTINIERTSSGLPWWYGYDLGLVITSPPPPWVRILRSTRKNSLAWKPFVLVCGRSEVIPQVHAWGLPPLLQLKVTKWSLLLIVTLNFRKTHMLI